MIAKFLKTRLIESSMCASALAKHLGLSVDEIEAVIGGEDISLSKAEHFLQVLGAESAVLANGQLWDGSVRPVLSINEKLYELFVWRTAKVSYSPIWFFLQYLNESNIDATADLLTKAIEFHEPRITVTKIAFEKATDRWDVHVNYFAHHGKMLSNFVFLFHPKNDLNELPEVGRRKAYENFVQQRKIESAVEIIGFAKNTLDDSQNDELRIDLALIQMQGLDHTVLDAEMKEHYHDTLDELKLRKSQRTI